jgi:hypothetical protein
MLLILTAACKKNFLDRFPQTSIPPDLFFNSEEDLSIYINGLLSIPEAYNGYVGDQDTDDKATTGSREIKNMMTGTPSSKTITSGWSWSRLRNINYFLHNYEKAAVSQEVKDHYAGLARYYRAVFYMDKVKRFSDVPWYSEVLNPSDTIELYKQRDPRKLVMDSVMADLEFASSHVKESVPTGTPGKWVVKLVYARIALYEGTFRKYHPELNLQSTANEFLEKARLIADEIISSNKFALHPNYAALFNSADLTANKEVLLANIYDQDLKRNGLNNSELHEYEMSPSRDLVQSYLMKDGSRFTDQAGYQAFGFVQEFQNRDPRLSQTLIPPGFMKAVNPPSVPVPYVQVFSKNFTGYHQLKGYINSTDVKTRRDVDFPAYRYAEVLLIYAETMAELGTLTQGDLDKSVNLLRSRAGITTPLNLATANGNVDPVLSAKYPDVSGANKGVILEIRREKRVEFAAEGYRFDDLMRWHAGKELEKIPEGMYFPGLGNYDLTGDGVEDIVLVDKNAPLPPTGTNAAGGKLYYYRAGNYGENVTVYLKNGNSGGPIVTDNNVPFSQITLNPNLAPQSYGWD